MRQAAKAACLSIGGLYYYFPDKYDLVLHGLHPEALKNRCLEFFEKSDIWRNQNIHKYYEDYLDFAVASIQFVRPSVYAALELGKEEFLSSVDSSVNMAAREFREIKRLILPGASDTDLDHIEHFLRRIMLSACLVKNISLNEVRNEMAAVFQSYSSALPYVYNDLKISIQEKQITE